jgi:hypothetical protein
MERRENLRKNAPRQYLPFLDMPSIFFLSFWWSCVTVRICIHWVESGPSPPMDRRIDSSEDRRGTTESHIPARLLDLGVFGVDSVVEGTVADV